MIAFAKAPVSMVMACLLISAPASAPTEGIERVATLAAPRAAHTSTTLTLGTVLIAGGMADAGSIADAELFDATDNSVRTIGPMSAARAGHTATLLEDGRVLIAGGYNGAYLNSLEIFDPNTGRFRPAGTLAVARSGQTATLMPDGRVLFVGGVGTGWTFLSSAELYDPTSGRSAPVGSMRVPRESHTATLLGDGRVLVIGGHNGRRPNLQVHASAEIYDPTTGAFQMGGALGTPRHKHDAVRLLDGRVLVIAGADHTDRLHYATTEIYTPASGAFAAGPTMASRRYKIAGTSVVLPRGDVLVTSGAAVAERLDMTASVFRAVPGRFPDAYRFAATAILPGGDILITGGYSDGNRNTDGVWRFSSPGERQVVPRR